MIETLSHQPFYHEHGLKIVEVNFKQRIWTGEKATDIYLGNAEKARLPHGLRRMVAQVFIILKGDDLRELLQGILGIFME